MNTADDQKSQSPRIHQKMILDDRKMKLVELADTLKIANVGHIF